MLLVCGLGAPYMSARQRDEAANNRPFDPLKDYRPLDDITDYEKHVVEMLVLSDYYMAVYSRDEIFVHDHGNHSASVTEIGWLKPTLWESSAGLKYGHPVPQKALQQIHDAGYSLTIINSEAYAIGYELATELDKAGQKLSSERFRMLKESLTIGKKPTKTADQQSFSFGNG